MDFVIFQLDSVTVYPLIQDRVVQLVNAVKIAIVMEHVIMVFANVI